MTEVLTKSEYARRLGVSPSAVSNWISRRRLTTPAMRADGMIDAALADQQLRVTIDVIRAAGQSRRGEIPQLTRTAPSGGRPPTAEPIDFAASRDLLRARADLQMMQAETRRRELAHQSGRYMLTSQVEAAWRQELSAVIEAMEGGFRDLAADLGGDSHRNLVTIRKWFRRLRVNEAARLREAAAAAPALVEDPVAL